jgi:putative transcriptional regulator
MNPEGNPEGSLGKKPQRSKVEKGSLLIASPEIDSGLFARAVMLVCEHSETGSFALIINKPLEMELIQDFLAFGNIENPKIQLRAGGPIQSNQLMLVHGEKDLEEDVLTIGQGIYLGGDVDFLQKMIKKSDGPPVLLCLGYCGWLSGQLEQECAEGLWMVSKATPAYLFDTSPNKLWQDVLKDMGGRYKTLSLMPEDLTLN